VTTVVKYTVLLYNGRTNDEFALGAFLHCCIPVIYMFNTLKSVFLYQNTKFGPLFELRRLFVSPTYFASRDQPTNTTIKSLIASPVTGITWIAYDLLECHRHCRSSLLLQLGIPVLSSLAKSRDLKPYSPKPLNTIVIIVDVGMMMIIISIVVIPVSTTLVIR
jgi:hypothetical protein